jgi:carbamate kinase
LAKIVVALGGNAILSKDASAEAQMKAVKKTAKDGWPIETSRRTM